MRAQKQVIYGRARLGLRFLVSVLITGVATGGDRFLIGLKTQLAGSELDLAVVKNSP